MIKIVTLQHRLGGHISTNEAVETKYDLPKNFILEKTGISKRVLFSEDENPITLAANLLKQISIEYGTSKKVAVFGSSNPYGNVTIPSATHQIAYKAGLRSIPVFHINYGCGGYLGAILSLVNYLKLTPETDAYLVLSDHPSSMVNQYQTEVLFSDAVHVSLWSNKQNREGIIVEEIFFETLLNNPFALNVTEGFWDMEGKKIVDFVRKVPGLIAERMDLLLKDFIIIPHQPNAKLLETLERDYQVPFYKEDVVRFGNTTCSAMMIALENVVKNQKIDKKILLIGFGDSESYGGIVLSSDIKGYR